MKQLNKISDRIASLSTDLQESLQLIAANADDLKESIESLEAELKGVCLDVKQLKQAYNRFAKALLTVTESSLDRSPSS